MNEPSAISPPPPRVYAAVAVVTVSVTPCPQLHGSATTGGSPVHTLLCLCACFCDCVSVPPQLHGSAISDCPELRARVDEVGCSQAVAWERLQSRINSALCLVSFLRSSTIS